MTADPALGSYLPNAGKTVGYQFPTLANGWQGHPGLPGLGGTFAPSNLALYGYGHQNPATLWDPDGEQPLICTPDNIKGEYRPEFFVSSTDYSQSQRNTEALNTFGIAWAGPIFGLVGALGRVVGVPEQKVGLLTGQGFEIVAGTTAAAEMIRIGGRPLSASYVEAGLGSRVPESWGTPSTLARHFVNHGADFGATNAEDYARQASQFLERSQAEGLPTKIDSSGTIRIYDPASNSFGAYNENGTTRTFFKPRSPTYFDRQPGVPATTFGVP
jgi:hypothetical protein